MATSAEDLPQQPQAPVSTSPNIIMLSWLHPASVSVDHLISSIEAVPTIRISSLKWCKDRKGVKHQFLLLEVERPDLHNLWIRLDKRLQQDPAVEDWVSSVYPTSPTTAQLSEDPRRLVRAARSLVKLEAEFKDPPSLAELRNLLLVLESSAPPKTSREDIVFCSVIYDYLSALGGGVKLTALPSKATASIPPHVRAKIKKYIDVRQSMYSHLKDSQESLSETGGVEDEAPEEDPREATEDGPDDNKRFSPSQGMKLRQSAGPNQRNGPVGDDDLASDTGPQSDDDSMAGATLFNAQGALPSGPSFPPSSRHRTFRGSGRQEHTNPFTQQWQLPIQINISSIPSYAASAPLHIVSLIWCKDRKGVPHEFLLLQMERPKNSTSWLRLDRRAHRNATRMELLSSTSASSDTAMLCTSLGYLYDPTESDVQVESSFTNPPTLETLGNVLSVIEEVSPKYKVTSENCFFFCSVLYENLGLMGGGQDMRGIPSKFALSLAPKARAEIDTYLRLLLPDAFPEGSLRNEYGQLLGPNGMAEVQFDARQFRVAVLVARFFQRLKTRADNRRGPAPPPSAANDTAHQFRVAVIATSFWQRLKTRADNNRQGDAPPPSAANDIAHQSRVAGQRLKSRASDQRVDPDPPTEGPDVVKAAAYSASILSVASEATLYAPSVRRSTASPTATPRNGPRRGRNS